MEMKLDMASVDRCNVSKCAYNKNAMCHANAITIGDGERPRCDTYFEWTMHTSRPRTAGVGACKVAACMHNQDLECSADNITVGPGADKADCLMFRKK